MELPEVASLFFVIRSRYDDHILQDVKRFISCGIKEARFTNHRIFNCFELPW